VIKLPETTLIRSSAGLGKYLGFMCEWARRFPKYSPLKPEEWRELKGHFDGDKLLDNARLKELLTKIRDS